MSFGNSKVSFLIVLLRLFGVITPESKILILGVQQSSICSGLYIQLSSYDTNIYTDLEDDEYDAIVLSSSFSTTKVILEALNHLGPGGVLLIESGEAVRPSSSWLGKVVGSYNGFMIVRRR